MKRQYIAIVEGATQNSGLKNTVAEATAWAENALNYNQKNSRVFICETVAVAERMTQPVRIIDIPKDGFIAGQHMPEKYVESDKTPYTVGSKSPAIKAF